MGTSESRDGPRRPFPFVPALTPPANALALVKCLLAAQEVHGPVQALEAGLCLLPVLDPAKQRVAVGLGQRLEEGHGLGLGVEATLKVLGNLDPARRRVRLLPPAVALGLL